MATLRWLPIVLAAGCLSEPARPHGLGPPVAPGSVIRHHIAVGDLNGDGYDDLATWGNEGAPGTNPTLFIYFGGELLENPDLRADLTLVSTQLDSDEQQHPKWYEAIEGAIYISADGQTRGVVLATGQDVAVTTDPANAATRYVYFSFFPIAGRALGTRQRTGAGGQFGYGGFAPQESANQLFLRDTRASLPAHQLVYGNNAIKVMAAPFDVSSTFTDGGWDGLGGQEYVDAAIVLPPQGASEDLLVVTDQNAYRTTNDGAPTFSGGAFVPLAGKPNGDRLARGRARGDHFYAVANDSLDSTISVIDVAGAADPLVYGLTATGPTKDLAIADLGGDDRLDIAVIEDGTLGVYRDLTLAGSAAMPAAVFGSRDDLAGYDALAVGNFHGDARLEIYVLSTADAARPIRCYRLASADTLERCASE